MEKWKKILYLSLILSFVVCSQKDEQNNSKSDKIFIEDSTLVAMVNDEPIHYNNVDEAAKQMILQTGLVNKVDVKDSVIQQQALDWLIANTLLKQEVQKYMIEVKDEEVESAIEIVKKRFPSEEQFLAALQEENITMRKFKENIVLDLKVQKLLEEQVVFQASDVTSEDAKEYYEQNSSKFEEPGGAHARQILVRVNNNATEAEQKKARKKIESVKAKLNQGQSFEELAKTYSEGPSASRGGNLGYFSRGDMVKEVDEAVFSMNPGDISDIVRTEFGFHLIKLEDFKESKKIPFERVENDIKNYLIQIKSQEQFDKFIKKLKEKATIKMRENS